MTVQLRAFQRTKPAPCEACKQRTGKTHGRLINPAVYEIVGGWVLEIPYVIQLVCEKCVAGIWGMDFTVVVGRLAGNSVPAHLRPVVA